MKAPKWLTAVADFCDGFAAYVATVLGVLISKVIPLLSANHTVVFSDLGLNWIRVGVAAVIALIIVGQQEREGTRLASVPTSSRAWGTLWRTG